MVRARRLIGVALAVAGLAVAVQPLLSVWRLSGEVLDRLPELDGVEAVDDRHPVSAFTHPDFVVAQRRWVDVDPARVATELGAAGFVADGPDGQLSQECCGSYDAMFVELIDDGDGDLVAEIRPADADLQQSAALFGLVGLSVAAGGLGLALHRGRSTTATVDTGR